jgi:hypothetical protein
MATAVKVPWAPSYRLVHSRFPPVTLFDACESEEELAIVAEVQGITKDRIQQELGRIHLVAEGDRLFGHGTTPVMAAFCYISPVRTRFSAGNYGVYYAADSVDCAVAEVSYHQTQFLAATQEPRTLVTLRCYSATIGQPMVDIRGAAWAWAHDLDNYSASQALAADLRAQGAWGLLYNSVRFDGGECVAVLRAPAIDVPVVQHSHVHLEWDGQRVASWYPVGTLKRLG